MAKIYLIDICRDNSSNELGEPIKVDPKHLFFHFNIEIDSEPSPYNYEFAAETVEGKIEHMCAGIGNLKVKNEKFDKLMFDKIITDVKNTLVTNFSYE